MRLAAATAGVHGRQRLAAIGENQPLRGLDGARDAARQRRRRFEELAMRGVTEVEIQMP